MFGIRTYRSSNFLALAAVCGGCRNLAISGKKQELQRAVSSYLAFCLKALQVIAHDTRLITQNFTDIERERKFSHNYQ
jgi:hypothetical protein